MLNFEKKNGYEKEETLHYCCVSSLFFIFVGLCFNKKESNTNKYTNGTFRSESL